MNSKELMTLKEICLNEQVVLESRYLLISALITKFREINKISEYEKGKISDKICPIYYHESVCLYLTDGEGNISCENPNFEKQYELKRNAYTLAEKILKEMGISCVVEIDNNENTTHGFEAITFNFTIYLPFAILLDQQELIIPSSEDIMKSPQFTLKL